MSISRPSSQIGSSITRPTSAASTRSPRSGASSWSSRPSGARVYIRFGEPIRLDALPGAAEDPAVVDRLNEQARGALQALIVDSLRRRHGIYWSSYDAGGENQAAAASTVRQLPRQAEPLPGVQRAA